MSLVGNMIGLVPPLASSGAWATISRDAVAMHNTNAATSAILISVLLIPVYLTLPLGRAAVVLQTAIACLDRLSVACSIPPNVLPENFGYTLANCAPEDFFWNEITTTGGVRPSAWRQFQIRLGHLLRGCA
jgi:hypothetical protein